MVEGLEAVTSDANDAVPLAVLLRQASVQVGGLGPEFAGDRSRLETLGARLHEERCHLAVLGQFKRGKSTLVNALLGEPILPAAVVPLTSIPTFLHGGEWLAARVLFEDGKPAEQFAGSSPTELAQFLSRYVTESANPLNRLGVRQVDATYPAPILRQGMALIDTPGIGSTFQHNTQATVNFLPQCDAALFVVSADPPITQVEVEFLKAARRTVARMFFILNKVDYLDANERRAAVEFLQRVLCEQMDFPSPPRIYCASARQGVAARQKQNPTLWQQSGMADIEGQIVDFLLTEKTEVLNCALARKANDILADIQRRLQLIVRSLQMPLAELDERIREFEENLIKIEEQRIVAMERLNHDEKRLADSITKHSIELLSKSMAMLEGIVRQCQEREGSKWSEDSTREAIAEAIPSFFEREFGMAHQLCEQELREALVPHRRRADALIVSINQLVQRLFEVPFDRPSQEITLAKVEQPFWRTHKWTIRFVSIPETWIDRLFPLRLRHIRIRRRIMEQVEYLATRNVGFLQWSVLQNLQQSVQDFRDDLNDGVQKTIETTRHALEAACQQRTADAATIASEVSRLESEATGLQKLRMQLSSFSSSKTTENSNLSIETRKA